MSLAGGLSGATPWSAWGRWPSTGTHRSHPCCHRRDKLCAFQFLPCSLSGYSPWHSLRGACRIHVAAWAAQPHMLVAFVGEAAVQLAQVIAWMPPGLNEVVLRVCQRFLPPVIEACRNEAKNGCPQLGCMLWMVWKGVYADCIAVLSLCLEVGALTL